MPNLIHQYEAVLERAFPGGSEMAQRCRVFDWSATALGRVDTWSPSFLAVVRMMLASPFAMIAWWSEQRIQVYNDAYIGALGGADRHPSSLGMRAEECWRGEIWEIVGPQLEEVVATGRATWHVDQYVPLPRNGRIEETYWTYTYCPLFDDAGRVAGVLNITEETTARVIAERREVELRRERDAQRAQLLQIVRDAPAFMAVLRGPTHVFELTNAGYDRLTGNRAVIGKTVAESLPEVVEQGFITLLDHVLASGEVYVGKETSVALQWSPDYGPMPPSGPDTIVERIINFVYQPLVGAAGNREGVVVHGVDVTEEVAARRHAEVARVEAEHERERLERLQALTLALAQTQTIEEVAAVIIEQTGASLGARTGALALPTAEGDALRVEKAIGFPPATFGEVAVQPLTLNSASS